MALTPEQVAEFHARGFLHVPGFYDVERDVRPIQQGVWRIVQAVRSRHGLPASDHPYSPQTFDDGYADLIARDRAWGGEVYDAVKQIPAFVRLAGHPRHEEDFRLLRRTDLAGVGAGGYGIRIDNPAEERFRADWHQEYPAQLRSLDGITFWSTLVPLTREMGPVTFCVGSHKGGMRPVHTRDPRNPEKTGAYGLVLADRDALVAQFEQVAPLPQPGDAVLIDYAVLHASGHNRGARSRWTSQIRYFNFREPTGIRIGWRGSFAAGNDFREVHPELVADEVRGDSPRNT